MSGIAGFINSKPSNGEQHATTIVNMLKRIDYRGPDELGYYFDESSAIGSVRLNTDKGEVGQQPFCDESNRYCLVCDGAIYNYKALKEELEQHGHFFYSTCDTEVLLKAWMQWGEAAFERFNGGYAFAIYDRFERSCILGRDRFGERPLYYTTVKGSLLFASEIKCFLCFPGMVFNWNTEALQTVLSTWTPLVDETVFRDVKQIPPGCYMKCSPVGISDIKEYYELKFQSEPFKGTEQDAIEATKEALRKSIKLRMCGDLEVGAYLSGGLDSTIITRLVAEESPSRVHSFSVSFEDNEFDESKEQFIASSYIGTKHERLVVSNKQIAEDFPACVWHAEVPLFRTALVPLYSLSKLVKSTGIKVVLTGEGADESFLGYDIFKETLLRQQWQTLSQAEKEAKVSRLYPYLKHFSTENVSALVGIYDKFSQGGENLLFSHELRFNNSKFVLRLLRSPSDVMSRIDMFVNKYSQRLTSLDPLKRTQWIEFKTLLAGYLLSSQGDRMSLANSVENRCPFLDHHVVEFADSLPVEIRLKGGIEEKHILKRTFADILPKEIVERNKQPYRAPDAAPFIGHERPEFVGAMLDKKRLSEVEFLDTEFCYRFANKILNSNPKAVSPRENQTLVSLLSILFLDSFFVQNENQQFSKRLPVNFSRQIDGRGSINNLLY